MKFDKEKLCFVNDDGSKLEMSGSLCCMTDRGYITYLQDAVAKTGKQTVDNTWQWNNKVKFSTSCHK